VDLRTVPSAVGGSSENRHGIILAKSTPAKAFHIKTGEPIGSALDKCPDLIVVPPHYREYSRRSKAFIELLSTYTDKLLQVSIDEAFLDMTSSLTLFGDARATADAIRRQVRETLGFTVNIGISRNQLLAKMASDMEKPDRTHTLWPEEIPEKMWPLPVSRLYFVGRSAQATLHKLGIDTIGELAQFDVELLRSHFGSKYAQTIHNYANGIHFAEVKKSEAQNPGIGNSVTLSHDVADLESAQQVLLSLAETVGARLRDSKQLCSCLTVEYKDWNFKRSSHQTTLTDATDSTQAIYQTACRLLSERWDQTPLRLLGIRAGKLSEQRYQQLSLFDTPAVEKQKKLDHAIDSIRNRFGTDSIQRASFLEKEALTRHIQGKENRES